MALSGNRLSTWNSTSRADLRFSSPDKSQDCRLTVMAGDNGDQVKRYASQNENAAENDEKQKTRRMSPVKSDPFNRQTGD